MLLGTSTQAHAAVFCVKTSSDLTSALGQAASNGQDNVIKIATGTIASTQQFTYSQSGAFDLDIEGGWSADCTTQRRDASLTILDGTSAGIAGGLSLETLSKGNITLRYLTLQNYVGGYYTLSMAALQDGNGDLRIENCMFRTNTAADKGDVVRLYNLYSGSGAAYFLDNALTGNIVSSSGVVARLVSESTASICRICANNNTVSGNTISSASTGAMEISSSTGAIYLANNVFWGNVGGDLYVEGSYDHGAGAYLPVLMNNDIGVEGGTTPAAGSTGNISIDPQFVNAAAGNYRLRATSPARDVGDNTPPGTIRNYDLDGTARIDGALVDMGAYEFHDVIFDDSFDKGA